MASILSLAEELVIEIISLFEDDRLQLNSLSLVSRRFHAIARKFLFRHLGIAAHTGPSYKPLVIDSEAVVQLQLLKRSFSENSSLRELIWTYGPVFLKRRPVEKDILPFCTDLSDQKKHWTPTFHATRKSIDLIESFPNLKELWISCVDTEIEAEVYEHTESVFDSPLLSRLPAIKIHGGGVEILSCMRLPNIREMVTTYFHLPQSKFPSHLRHKSTTLRKLEIGGHECPVQLDQFTNLVMMCPQLEELKVDGMLNARFSGFPPAEYTFHTEGVLDSLNLVRSTLRSLEIIIPSRSIIESEFQETPLDLSQFHGLVHLRISGMYFFPLGDPHPSKKKDVHRLLPRNLESLQIDSAPQCGFARVYGCDQEIIHYNPKDDTVSLPPDRYDWIFQFATLKEERFPNLLKLALLDNEFNDGREGGPRAVEWKQPEDVEWVFAAAGIDLSVEILLYEDEW